jgi:hypothetical protein
MFLLRVLDAFPAVSPWISWMVGIILSVVTLYHGLPRVMLPDPPHAFGYYVSTAFLLFFLTGLIRFLTAWYLQGKYNQL